MTTNCGRCKPRRTLVVILRCGRRISPTRLARDHSDKLASRGQAARRRAAPEPPLRRGTAFAPTYRDLIGERAGCESPCAEPDTIRRGASPRARLCMPIVGGSRGHPLYSEVTTTRGTAAIRRAHADQPCSEKDADRAKTSRSVTEAAFVISTAGRNPERRGAASGVGAEHGRLGIFRRSLLWSNVERVEITLRPARICALLFPFPCAKGPRVRSLFGAATPCGRAVSTHRRVPSLP